MKYTFSNLEQDTDKTKNNYDMLFDLTFSIANIFFFYFKLKQFNQQKH